MKLKTAFADGVLRLSFSGEMDHHGARSVMTEVEDRLDQYMPRDCILDMKDISFMDSSGIAVVIKTYRRMGACGGRLRVENVPPQPMKVLDASGIDRIIDISALELEGRGT